MKNTFLHESEALKYDMCHGFQKKEENQAVWVDYLNSSQIASIQGYQVILLEIHSQAL